MKRSPLQEPTTLPLLPPSLTASSFMAVTPAPPKDLTTAGGSRSLTTAGPVFLEIRPSSVTKSLLLRHLHQEPTLVLATTTASSGFMAVMVVLTTPALLSAISTLSTSKQKLGPSTNPPSPRPPYLRVVVDTLFSLMTRSSTPTVAGTPRPNTTTSSSST